MISNLHCRTRCAISVHVLLSIVRWLRSHFGSPRQERALSQQLLRLELLSDISFAIHTQKMSSPCYNFQYVGALYLHLMTFGERFCGAELDHVTTAARR